MAIKVTNKELNDFLSKFPSVDYLIDEAIWSYDFQTRLDEFDYELGYNPDDYIDEDDYDLSDYTDEEKEDVYEEIVSERIERQITEEMCQDIIEMEDDIEEFKTYILAILMNKIPANCIKELKEFLNQNITQEIFDEFVLDAYHR